MYLRAISRKLTRASPICWDRGAQVVDRKYFSRGHKNCATYTCATIQPAYLDDNPAPFIFPARQTRSIRD